MKKDWIWILALALAVVMAGCRTDEGDAGQKALTFVNERCDMPIKLAMQESALGETADLERWDGYGGYDLSNETVRYTLTGYPDVLDALHVTKIRLLSDNYQIFGVTVGDPLTEAAERFASFGFREDAALSETHSGLNGAGESIEYCSLTMEMDGVILCVEGQNGCISELSIELAVTNKHNVVF